MTKRKREYAQDLTILQTRQIKTFPLLTSSVHKNPKNKLSQYPAISTSRIINNAYMSCYGIIIITSPFSIPGLGLKNDVTFDGFQTVVVNLIEK